MNVHRLAALSTTAVIAAACSSGGSSPAPHAAATSSSAAPSLAKHAPNTKLTLSFSKNIVHVNSAHRSGSKLTATAKRKPKFLDPGSEDVDYIEIAVTNTSPSGATTSSYMAATDIQVSPDPTSGTQTIPIYLAPGTDSVLVQEVGEFPPYEGYLLGAGYSGYLLSQGIATDQYGDQNIPVGEGVSEQLSVAMQLVLGSMNQSSTYYSGAPDGGYPATSGLAILTNIGSSYYATGYFSPSANQSYSSVCVSNGTSLYFLPVDDNGDTYAFNTYNNPSGPGNVESGYGLPQFYYNVSPAGSTTTNAFGGTTINFDANNDPITIEATFYSVVVDPTTFGYNPYSGGNTLIPAYAPFSNGGTSIDEISAQSYVNYYATIYSTRDSTNCQSSE